MNNQWNLNGGIQWNNQWNLNGTINGTSNGTTMEPEQLAKDIPIR